MFTSFHGKNITELSLQSIYFFELSAGAQQKALLREPSFVPRVIPLHVSISLISASLKLILKTQIWKDMIAFLKTIGLF